MVPELAKSLLVYNLLSLSVIFPPLFYLRNQLIYEQALFMINGNFYRGNTGDIRLTVLGEFSTVQSGVKVLSNFVIICCLNFSIATFISINVKKKGRS